jgi:two-component system sensor histidine kinase VicK
MESLSIVLVSPITYITSLFFGTIGAVGGYFYGQRIEERDRERILYEKLHNDFISMVTHELRTPLTLFTISNEFVEKLVTANKNDHRITESFKIIYRNVSRMQRLVSDLSDYTQIESDRFKVNKREFNLTEYIQLFTKKYEILLGDNFEYKSKIPENMIVNLDEDRISQVLDNLINNSIKNTDPKHRKIELNISHFETDQPLIFKVKDNGSGIKEEHTDNLFSPFYSVSSEYKHKSTGLGLFISKSIINMHEGKISFQNNGSEAGVTFLVEIPI